VFISQLKMFFVSGSFFITVYFHTQFPGPFFLTQYGRVTDGRTDTLQSLLPALAQHCTMHG